MFVTTRARTADLAPAAQRRSRRSHFGTDSAHNRTAAWIRHAPPGDCDPALRHGAGQREPDRDGRGDEPRRPRCTTDGRARAARRRELRRARAGDGRVRRAGAAGRGPARRRGARPAAAFKDTGIAEAIVKKLKAAIDGVGSDGSARDGWRRRDAARRRAAHVPGGVPDWRRGRAAARRPEELRQRPIGVFDSGVGGLTVLHELLVPLPHEDFVYLGDTRASRTATARRRELEAFALRDRRGAARAADEAARRRVQLRHRGRAAGAARRG